MSRTITFFWGICVDKKDIYKVIEHYKIPLSNHIKIQDEFHITLLDTGRYPNVNEVHFKPIENLKCGFYVIGYGITDYYITLQVANMVYLENDIPTDVPFFGTIPHITIGCARGYPSSNSISAFTNFIKFDNPPQLYGKIANYTPWFRSIQRQEPVYEEPPPLDEPNLMYNFF